MSEPGPCANCANLRRELTIQRQRNHARNVELDALHFVWCTGGCPGGTHRWTEGTITEELVQAAELNAKRLRSWLINATHRAARAAPPVGTAPPAGGPK